MASRATQMFRSGEISGKQAGKLGILKQTRTNPSWGGGDAKAEGGGSRFAKKGNRDEGQAKDLGALPYEHLDHGPLQNTGSPQRASGLPSKGGRAPMGGRFPHSEEIDEPERQKPDFARGAGRTGRPSTAKAPFKRSDHKTAQRRGDNNGKGTWSKPRAISSSSNPSDSGDYYGGNNNRRTG